MNDVSWWALARNFILPTFHVFTKNQIAFQTYLTGLCINHSYLGSQLSSANNTPLGFDMPSGYSVEEMRAESVIIKTFGSEKNCTSLMLAASADGMKWLLHVILKYNAMPKKQLPTRWLVSVKIKDGCLQTKGLAKFLLE